MVNIKSLASALAVLGSGALLTACGASAVKANEVPAAQGGAVSAGCGATGKCGAKGTCGTQQKSATEPAHSATAREATAACGSAKPAATDPKPPTTAATLEVPPATPAAPKKADPVASPKKGHKMAGAQAGCGQGSCG